MLALAEEIMELTPLALDHLALPVFDVAASRRFYGELLALPLLSAQAGDDWGGRPWLMMIYGCGEGRTLALFALAGSTPPPPGDLPAETRHVALRVGSLEELSRWRSKLEAARVAITEEDHGDQLSLYFADPSSHVFELTAYRRFTSEQPSSDAEAVVSEWLRRK